MTANQEIAEAIARILAEHGIERSEDDYKRFHLRRLKNRHVDTLTGIVQGVVSDGNITHKEVEYLRNWFDRQHPEEMEPILLPIQEAIETALEDGKIDPDEERHLLGMLCDFVGESTEEIERIEADVIRPTTLPLDDPPPVVDFHCRRFVFTGTFDFGTRSDCQAQVVRLGGVAAPSLTKKTDYLVIGNRVTGAWKHERFGLKIMKAAKNRSEGVSVAIIDERHWRKAFEG